MRQAIRGTLLGIAIGACGWTAPAFALDPVTVPATPAGAATMSSVWQGPMTADVKPPQVLQAVRITVAPGGEAGPVRLRVGGRSGTGGGALLGDWFTLPAEPGTYTFPAPRIAMDPRMFVVALDQQTGRHAIVRQSACAPGQDRYADPCELIGLDVWRPILPDGEVALPWRPGGAGTPTSETVPGQQLQVEHVSELDLDGDLAGDRTEDRSDLGVRADAVRGGRTAITVTNNGPRTADWPLLTLDRPTTGLLEPASGWTPECLRAKGLDVGPLQHPASTYCGLPAIAPGQSHTVSLPTIDDGRPLVVTVAAEGPDLAPADNVVSVVPREEPPALRPAPVAKLTVPARARARRGLRLRLRSETAATARATLSVRWRGKLRTTTRTMALRADAARTIVMRSAKVRGMRPTGRATLTVTVTAPGSETRTLRRVVRIVP